jgi:hypothetical protein
MCFGIARVAWRPSFSTGVQSKLQPECVENFVTSIE